MLRQLFCIVFLSWTLLMSAQSTNCSTGLVLESVEAQVGDVISINVTTRNLETVIGLQYNHSWNPAILEFVEVHFPEGSEITANNFNLSPDLTNNGILNFSYIDNNLSGIDLADNSTLYELRFIYQGGGSTVVSTNGENLQVELVNVDIGVISNYYFLHATVTPASSTAFPVPATACIESQSCNEPTSGRIALENADPPFSSIVWNGPAGYSATGSEISGLSPGVYQLELTDDNGQTTNGDFYLSGSDDLNLSLTVDADECGDSPDGAITTSIEGGSGNYSYVWSNGATTANLSDLTDGTYSVTVTDLSGSCSISATTTVISIAPFSIWYETENPSCNGASDGSITIYSDASGDALPLSYLWWFDGSNAQTVTGLSAGVYEVLITGANGCNSILEIVLVEESFSFESTVIDNTCNNNEEGSISIALAVEDYTFDWSNDVSGVNSISGLSAGLYAVTVTESASGCVSTTSYEVGTGEIISAINVECYLEGNVELADLTALIWNNDDGPYSFAWSNGITNSAEQISSITVSENGTYTLTITSANGCTVINDNIEVSCIGGSQVNLHFDPLNSVMETGDNQCIAVKADGFTNIAGFQFTVDWDSDVLTYTGLQNFGLPNMNESNFGTLLAPDGKLSISWIDATLLGETLPSGSTLFEVCFEAIANEMTFSNLSVTDIPTIIEFINADTEILSVSSQTALVTVNGGTNGGDGELEILAGSAEVEIGNLACVPISISAINDLLGFQFTLAWDPAALQFSGVHALNLPNFMEGFSFGSLAESQNDGLLRVLWDDFSVMGSNFPQETIIFEACFLAVGPAGTYPLTFDETVLPREGVKTGFEYIPTSVETGEITISDDPINPGDDVSLLINSAAVGPGESICLPVEVVNFEDIVGLQFSMSWDDELLIFNGVQFPEELDFLAEESYNALAGGDGLVFSWVASNLLPISLDEGTVIFELCFTAGSEEGTAGVIFSHQPTPIEFIRDSDVIPFIPVNGLVTISTDGLVWPGDQNNDGFANNFDLLHLGLAFGASGPARNNASTNWQSQYAAPWSSETPESHTNYRHIDANGDGLINAIDTTALSLNWGQNVEGFTGGGNGMAEGFTGAPIYVQESTVQAGVRVRIPIMLGNDETEVEGAYGLAFTIVYDPEMVEAQSPRILNNGWLGSEEDGLIGMYRDFSGLGRIEAVMVRTDGQNIDGNGQVAELSIIMEDVIIRSLIDVEVEFQVENVRLISYQETALATSARTTTVLVEGVTSTDEPAVLQELTLSPNPTSGSFAVTHPTLILEQLILQDTKGRTLESLKTDQQTIDLNGYPAGVYILKIQTDQGIAYRKLVKQ